MITCRNKHNYELWLVERWSRGWWWPWGNFKILNLQFGSWDSTLFLRKLIVWTNSYMLRVEQKLSADSWGAVLNIQSLDSEGVVGAKKNWVRWRATLSNRKHLKLEFSTRRLDSRIVCYDLIKIYSRCLISWIWVGSNSENRSSYKLGNILWNHTVNKCQRWKTMNC